MDAGDSFAHFMAMIGRMLIPCLFILLLFILNVVSMSYGALGTVKAPLFLIAVYYWSIYRPSLMPVWLVFLAGVTLDLLSGLPVGMNAIVFLVTRWVITDQRKFLMAQPFVMFWSIFAAIAALAGLLQWALFGLVNLGWTPLMPVGMSVALGIMLFPFVATLLYLTHKLLPPGGSFGS